MNDRTDLVRPSFIALYLQFARMLALRSTCRRLKVGAVLTTTDFRKVVSLGYNGNARGLANDCDSDEPGKCGCFISGTSVSASGVTKAYRRRYEGEVARVITSSGEFTATPNHPVLAANFGWIACQSLNKGDYLFRSLRNEHVTSSTPRDYNRVSIEQVFESLRVTGRSIRRSGAGHDFHGDGLVDEEVDVVAIDRSLPADNQALLFEQGAQPSLSTPFRVQPALGGLGSVSEFVSPDLGHESRFNETVTDDDHTDTEVSRYRRGGLSFPIARENIFDRKINHSLSLMPAEILGHFAKNAELTKAVLDRGMGDRQGSSNSLNRLASEITASKILAVERNRWTGHVYNLETKNNWYSVGEDAFIAHNCLHAEENAVIKCDVPMETPKFAFCTHQPCVLCAKRLINMGGLTKLFYIEPYRSPACELLVQSGVECIPVSVEDLNRRFGV